MCSIHCYPGYRPIVTCWQCRIEKTGFSVLAQNVFEPERSVLSIQMGSIGFSCCTCIDPDKAPPPLLFFLGSFSPCEESPFYHCLFLERTRSLILLEGSLYDSMWLALTEVARWHFMLIWAAIHVGSRLTFSRFNNLSLSWWQTDCWHSDILIFTSPPPTPPHSSTLQACHII